MKWTNLASLRTVGGGFVLLAGAACSTVNVYPSAAVCGDGRVDGTEACDDGNSDDADDCRNDCTTADAAGGAGGGGGAGGAPAGTEPTVVGDGPCFAGVVSNNTDPSVAGPGIESRWTYQGSIGLQAGQDMCLAIGADHVCSYDEVLAADAAGALGDLPDDLSYWLYRTGPVIDPILGKTPCQVRGDGMEQAADDVGNSDDCVGGGDYCDPLTQLCSLKAAAGARCNDFTYPTGHLWDGEWFARADGSVDPVLGGGMPIGTLVFHFDRDPRIGRVSHQDASLGGGGLCGGARRAILCCNTACR